MQTNGQTERKKRENVDKQYVAWCAKKTKRFVVQNRKEKRTHHTTSTIANLKTEKNRKKITKPNTVEFYICSCFVRFFHANDRSKSYKMLFHFHPVNNLSSLCSNETEKYNKI